MKIRKVALNNRKKCFEVTTSGGTCDFPYAKLEIRPSPSNPIGEVHVDKELGSEAFTYSLQSGEQGTVHVDHVLEYNQDPRHMRDLLLYRTTLEVQERVKKSRLGTREIIRRLGTSASQFYRVMDQTNYRKSFKQLLDVLHVLDYEVTFVIKPRVSKVAEPRASAAGTYSRRPGS